MSQSHNTPAQHCRGPFDLGTSRRAFLRTGLAGFATLSLPGILRLRAQQSVLAGESAKSSEKTAVIMVWQPGGLSHIDSYDPKPNAGSEYRGPFGIIPTKVPGLNFTELLPRQAAIADGRPPKYAGHCRGLTREEARRRIERGQAAVIRFRVPEGRDVVFNDIVRGEVRFSTDVIGDPVLVRSDGVPAYNYAVVIDDALIVSFKEL